MKNNLITVLCELENNLVFTYYYKYVIYFPAFFFVETELDYLHIISTVVSIYYLSSNKVLCGDLNTGE